MSNPLSMSRKSVDTFCLAACSVRISCMMVREASATEQLGREPH